jgi:hypothetical protein
MACTDTIIGKRPCMQVSTRSLRVASLAVFGGPRRRK